MHGDAEIEGTFELEMPERRLVRESKSRRIQEPTSAGATKIRSYVLEPIRESRTEKPTRDRQYAAGDGRETLEQFNHGQPEKQGVCTIPLSESERIDGGRAQSDLAERRKLGAQCRQFAGRLSERIRSQRMASRDLRALRAGPPRTTWAPARLPKGSRWPAADAQAPCPGK